MNDNLLIDFLAECREHLEGIETDLLAIEESGESADKELINKVFRAAHSIKGGSGFFQLDKIKSLAHSIETVLDMMRSAKMKPNAEIINILLLGFDQLRAMVNNLDSLDQFDITSHVSSLQNLAIQHQSSDEKGSMFRNATLTTEDGSQNVVILEIDLQAARKEQQYIYLLEYNLFHDVDHLGKNPVELFKSLSSMGVIIETILDIAFCGTLDDQPKNDLPLKLIYRTVLEPDYIAEVEEIRCEKKIQILFKPTNELDASSKLIIDNKIPKNKDDMTKETTVDKDVPKQEPENKSTEKPLCKTDEEKQSTKGTVTAAPETLRINVESLDTLMAHAGELVLSRNQLIDAISRTDYRAISTSAQRLSFVISELQEAVMQTRLQPVGNVFNKFPRVVRDMSILLKKELRLILEGKDVELDKTIVEGLSDPLTHMVRNAADHGIESQSDRISKGKPAVGTISLKAFHEAGQVVVEVEDDGKGIDPEKIASKALAMGFITSDRLKGMTDFDKTALIFLPGLSTADKITETSGRGVGMDVVKTNLDRLGGKVAIHSVLGKGTSFRIKLPLTLAIIPSLIISENGERFAIPQVNVVELLRIPAAQLIDRIQVVGDAEVVVLRGELIPLVRFSEIIGITSTYIDPSTGKKEIDRRNRISDRRSVRKEFVDDRFVSVQKEDHKEKRKSEDRRFHASSDLNIVIIASGLLQYGLVVGELHNTQEIVVKPLGRHLKTMQEYAGATIMGDGEVALILDATGIALKANITSVSAAAKNQKDIDDEVATLSDGTQSLLLFYNHPEELCAMPLDLVQRVESIEYNQIEMKGGKRTMKYRGASLPLVQLSDVANAQPIPKEGELAVVVTSVGGHPVGLLGLLPVSVLENELKIDTVTHRQKGISGSSIINDTTVLIVDIYEIVEVQHPEWILKKKSVSGEKHGTILLAEDSDFFRGQIEKYITEAGYEVIAAKDGLEGWQLLEKFSDKIQLVVTDIEMPRMNGLELCRKIKGDNRFSKLQVIALTSLASHEDEVRGKEAGIDDYQVKLDRDRLIIGIQKVIENVTL